MEKKTIVLTQQDQLKYEIADELGLLDKVRNTGWKSLTARESGRIGGLMAKKKREDTKTSNATMTNDPRM